MAGLLSWLGMLPIVALVLQFAPSAFAATVAPAFIWSDIRSFGAEDHSVDYQIYTPTSLVNNLFERFHSPQKQESTKEDDLLVVFIGHELHLAEVARSTLCTTDTLYLIKNTVTASKFSVVLPHVHFGNERESFVNVLIESIEQAEKQQNIVGKLKTFHCDGASGASESFGSIQDVEEFFTAQEDRDAGKTDVLVICDSSFSKEQSDGKNLGKLFGALSYGRRKYTAVYVSDLSEKNTYMADLHVRQLIGGDGPANQTFCDEVCQTKAALLEALFVGVTLIFILVLGICCMAGVQTPTRFEAPKES